MENNVPFVIIYVCPTADTEVAMQPNHLVLNNDCQCAWLTIQDCPACHTYHYFMQN